MLFGGVSLMVSLHPQVVDGPAVRHHHSVESPFIPQNLHQQAVASAAGLSLEAVVGTHHFLYMRFLHQILEGRQVGFPQVARGDVFGVELVTVPFRARMHGKVLGAGVQLVIAGVFRPLQSAHHGHAHLPCQVRVFPIGFLSASPARVAEYVYVRCPEGQPLIALQSAAFAEFGGFGPCLVGYGGEHLVQQAVVKRGRHADGLRIDRGESRAGHAVKCLVPPVVCLDAQPRNGRRSVLHQCGLLLQGQPAKEICRTFFRRE